MLDGVPLIVAASLQGPWQRAVHAYKYGGRRNLAATLAHPLTAAIHRADLLLSSLTPIPLHPDRQRTRGFNQAEWLARALGTSLSVPVLTDLQRTRDTPAQVTLGKEVRRLNLAGAFAWTGREAPRAGIGLVDDVCTTGSTLLAAADAIRATGGGVAAFLVLAAPVYPAPGTAPEAAAGAGQAASRPAQSLSGPAVTSPATRAGSRI